MIVTLLGASGNMGERVLATLVKEDFITKIKILAHNKKSTKEVLKANKKYKEKIEYFYGTVGELDDVKKAIIDADYVINMAAVIPPLSDKNPLAAIEANETGVKNIIEAIEAITVNQPKFIHISTVGLYGDRNYKHPFAEVGDPLLISPFDLYALTKLRGEFNVLESNIKTWTVLRQTAVLYKKMLMKNISDGLMFHTCFNAPLEWVTANDSAILIRNILKSDLENKLNYDNFWKHCFSIAGGEKNRITGFETLDEGFEIIGCSTYDFFDTNYNSLRNFHGVWFSDGYKLNDLFDYQHDTTKEFWAQVLKDHPYFNLAKICPKKLMKQIVIKRLLKDSNAPYYWYNQDDEARLLAYFNGKDKFDSIPEKWDEFNLLIKNKGYDGTDVSYDELRKNPTRLNHYFDIDKKLTEVTIEDLKSVALAHGGKLLTDEFLTGDVYSKVEWETQDGEKFFARPYTVLFCGHWWNVSYKEYAWDFDRLAKKDKIYAQIWYSHHEENENNFYYFDEKFNAHYKKI